MSSPTAFTPYIPAHKIMPEMTITAVILGIILSVIFGAANAYLGLRVGMTVSASIPAAVISMGIIRLILKRESILENSLVQTIGSAGESVAAGAIFTLPAIYLWAHEGLMDKPSYLEIASIGLVGGLLGVFFMVPLRNALIVKQHGILPYPEGTACAQVLLAGEKGSNQAMVVFHGLGISALFKFIIDGLKAVPDAIATANHGIGNFCGGIGTQIYPAIISVGYICGLRISAILFAGGFISWMVIIPLMVSFGGESIIKPQSITIASLFENGGLGAIWSSYIRYIGAGALVTAGLLSLLKTIPMLISTLKDSIRDMSGPKGPEEVLRTHRDMSPKILLLGIILCILFIGGNPHLEVGFGHSILIVIFGFFFAAVSSRIVGIVGSSNNPASGMTIATILAVTLILVAMGIKGVEGMKTAITIGTIVAIIICIAGDASQDLKTGFLVGETPIKQQIGEIIGTVAAASAIAFILNLLDAAYGFGSAELGAPQALLMKTIIESVMGGDLPWSLVIIGAALSVAIFMLNIPALPFAIGVYLPVSMTCCMFIGGLIRYFFDKRKYQNQEHKDKTIKRGLLFCSGMIAGEGIVGILLALFAVMGISKAFDISGYLNYDNFSANIVGLIALFLIVLTTIKFISGKKSG